MPRAKNEWRREPYPGELAYHLKWTHGVWVSEKTTSKDLEAIHRQLHGPPPEDWQDGGTWAPDHKHVWSTQPPILPVSETGEPWKW